MTASALRAPLAWLTEASSPEVRERLLTTLIQRRPSVYISCLALMIMSVAAALLVQRWWAYAWLISDTLLIGYRLYLSFRYDDGVRPPTKGRDAVIVSSLLLFTTFGLGCAASIAADVRVLTLMAVVSVMGLLAGLVSRWAAFPRLALLTIVIVALPVCVSLATLAGGGLWLAALQFGLVTVTTGAQTIQNHRLLVRMLRAEQRNRQVARTDVLTGLGNRARLYGRLGAACRRLRQNPDNIEAHFALLYVDLDGFKPVNDAYGHGVGDRLLEAIGQRLSRALQPGESAYRIGGDEFVIIVPCTHAAYAERRAGQFIQAVNAPHDLDLSAPVAVGASIGIALAPADGRDPQRLIAHADRALYGAKEAGKGCFMRFAA